MNIGVPEEKPPGRGPRTNNKLTFVVTFWIRKWVIPAAGKCFYNSPTLLPYFHAINLQFCHQKGISSPTLNLKKTNKQTNSEQNGLNVRRTVSSLGCKKIIRN